MLPPLPSCLRHSAAFGSRSAADTVRLIWRIEPDGGRIVPRLSVTDGVGASLALHAAINRSREYRVSLRSAGALLSRDRNDQVALLVGAFTLTLLRLP